MKRLYINLSARTHCQLLSWSLFFALLLGSAQLRAQQATIPANKDISTPFISTATAFTSAALSATTTTTNGVGVVYWENGNNCVTLGLPIPCGPNEKDNVTNTTTSDFARVHFLSAGGTARLGVKDGTAANTYSAGNFAGFVIANSSILGAGLLGTITIATYNNNVFAEASTSNTLIGVSSSLVSGAYEVGFITTKPFDEIQIRFEGLVSADTYDVYYAVQRRFVAGPSLACNTRTPFVTVANSSTATGFPAAIDPTHTGVSGVTTLTISSGEDIIDSDLTNFGLISAPVAGISGPSSVSVSVKDQATPGGYAIGTFAGFDVQNTAVIGASLLGSTTINTYLAGAKQETVTGGANSLISIPLLSAVGRQTIGFVTTKAFDEVQIVFSGTVGFSIGGTRIYSVVLKSFCAAPTLVCSTSAVTPLTNTTYPVYINNTNTGIGSIGCAGCGISNAENVINGSASAPATISLGAGVASSISFAVANALDTYPAETFAGFDLESNTLLAASLAGRTTITLYNNGTAVQTGTGSSLLVGATLLSGSRQTIGTVAQVPFDEIVITFNQLGAVNLGVINIYRAVVQKACVVAVACNQTKFLKNNEFSAVIEGTRTGFSGGVAAVNFIRDPSNVVSASTADFAHIVNVAGGLVKASISVADPANVYPAGTFAGYTISKANFPVSATLFSSLTVTTYLNGVLQQSSVDAGNLIDLSVFLQIFGEVPSGTLANVGFITSKPFDEIQLSVGSFASVGDFVDVYGAFIDTRTSSNGGSLVCNLNPDFNVTAKNVPVSGNVSTNDVVPTGTTYSSPTPAGGNPSGATITLTTAGVYSFTATTPGTYTYTVSVCGIGQTNCPTTPLIITVLDPLVTTNNPVANPDYASVQSSTVAAGSVTVNVRANDGPGNVSPGNVPGTLDLPTITTGPTHGTATVNGSGNVVYTPATGYVGDDILTYQVCESPSGLCATAQVTIHVVAPASSTVSIDDDYVKTQPNQVVSGNVLTNDQGTGLTVSNAGTIVSPGKGTLVLTSTGSYTFTPTSGVTGPVDFTYTACDNSATAVCGTATLHILVSPVPDLIPIMYARPLVVYNTTNITVVVDVVELNSVTTTGEIKVRVTKDSKVSLILDPMATLINGRSVNNNVWGFDGTSNINYYILTTSQSVAAGDKLSFGLTGVLTPGATTGGLSIGAVLVGGTTGEIPVSNNSDADKVDYFQQ